MKIQAIVSSVALAAALTFSGAAVAQNMMNGMEIPAEQIPAFQEKCDALRAAGTASLTTSDDQSDTTDATATGTVATDSTATDETSDPAAQDNWELAMASLTIEQCDEAGFAASAM
jgi:hypothetical protein